MAFLTRTRIVQVATGTPAAPVAIADNTFRTGAAGVVVATMAEAMGQVPAGQRPPQADWWQYKLEYLVDYVVIPTLRGVKPSTPASNTIVFDAAFWETAADLAANPNNPPRRNTFSHHFTVKSVGGTVTAIRASIDDYLVRAHFGNYPPDDRDLRIATTTDPTFDPLGLLTRFAALNNQPIAVVAKWREA